MHLSLFQRQCVSCPLHPPACTCSADQSCVQISQSCNACPTFTCQPSSTSSSNANGSSGISSGALAGAIVAVLLVLIGALLVFFLYRRRQRARQVRNATVEDKQDVPAPAEAVLSRPDPTEKLAEHPPPSPSQSITNTVRVYPSSGESVIDLDPRSQTSLNTSRPVVSGGPLGGNPFDDGHSIQTTSTTTNGTNVIPIALVSPDSAQSSSPSESGSLTSNSPSRPARPNELVLDTSRTSLDTFGEPSRSYAHSQYSGASRASYASNASYSSDFLNEAPMIVTHAQGAVRQVVGKVRAEVIQTSGSATPTTPMSMDSLKPPSTVTTRPSVRSPLAATSFGPADIVDEADEERDLSPRDPFGDHHAPLQQVSDKQDPKHILLPSQLGSVADDGTASGADTGHLLSVHPDQKSPHSPRLIPHSPTPSGTLQEQQQRALAHAQAQARAQGFDKSKRASGISVVSTTSTRADSILESFPFVPPSPIASRPVRSPPRSPLGQQSTSANQLLIPGGSTTAASLLPNTGLIEDEIPLSPLEPPPSRRILGMSTGSELSTASSGLGNFPFQIDHGGTEGNRPISASQARQRASLDTLALMSDLSSYPLGYDRDDLDSLPPLPKG